MIRTSVELNSLIANGFVVLIGSVPDIKDVERNMYNLYDVVDDHDRYSVIQVCREIRSDVLDRLDAVLEQFPLTMDIMVEMDDGGSDSRVIKSVLLVVMVMVVLSNLRNINDIDRVYSKHLLQMLKLCCNDWMYAKMRIPSSWSKTQSLDCVVGDRYRDVFVRTLVSVTGDFDKCFDEYNSTFLHKDPLLEQVLLRPNIILLIDVALECHIKSCNDVLKHMDYIERIRRLDLCKMVAKDSRFFINMSDSSVLEYYVPFWHRIGSDIEVTDDHTNVSIGPDELSVIVHLTYGLK